MELTLWRITLQPDDKIIGIGQGYVDIASYVIRLNADGSVDSNFTANTSLGNIFRAVSQRDGKILVIRITSFNKPTSLARLNSDIVLTWPDGDSSPKTFTLPIVNDAIYEGSENLTLNIAGVYGGAVAGTPATTTLTILDNDPEPCDPLKVTEIMDNGKGDKCGTLSYALVQPVSPSTGLTITFALSSGNTITMTNKLIPTVQSKVKIDGGDCASGQPIIINGAGVAGDGLRLGGKDRLINLWVKGFAERQIYVNPISGAGGNVLKCVKVSKT